ncbi:AsmA-like C-terminal region-containing protein [Flavobacterium sp. ASW18X]|uniref:AsmA-like C-terminal region-containing protein n=1 Tax=Flavobacterium sp. ASW18X TaxID=2572595 RepID=UPI0010AE1DC2|nr:AsmA-like C-terminal region-containing protein [Flavobacterium sp. ASW18X]TKD66681.1 AsmA family protein [Flavobacterium sp. ASW18X]
MKKKLLKIVGIFLLVIIGLAIALPFFLEGKIATIIKNKVNQNMNATLDFEEANLSLIKSFPNAHVNLKGISLVNKAPFEGDTLFASESLALNMSIKELFKGAGEPIGIKSILIDGARLHIKVDKEGNANYDVALPEEPGTAEEESGANNEFSFDLQEYAISNSDIIYDDFATGMHMVINEMNHKGTGDFSLAKSELDTHTDALVSFEMDSTKYLNKNKVALDALLAMDLENSRYTFLDNKALVNQLPLVFDGFVQVNEANQEIDISFKTPSSDFKNFLAVIPEAYSKNIENVKTTGTFEVSGRFYGIVDDTHIPKFNIDLKSDNASFKYPDLPKAVTNVFIDTKINNETGITEDTYVNLDRLSFKIDQDVFNVNAKIRDLLGNTRVNAHMDGKMNLANLSKAYPLPVDYGLSGMLNADVTTAFDMASLEQKKYANTKTNGTASLTGFNYASPELKNPVNIERAEMTFNPTTVTLNSFKGKTGSTDFNATGAINNLLGYLFNDENIEGNFKLSSNNFAVNDFMVEEAVTTDDSAKDIPAETTERVKIPSFLDCTIDATAANVLYDDIKLKDVSGRLLIKDETATLQNLTSSLFDGKVGLNGNVSTKGAISTFEMALDMNQIQIGESFKMLDMFKVLAPVANALQGTLNTDIKLSGNLKDDMTLNLATLSGDMLAQLLSTDINAERAPLLTALSNKLSFINLDKLDLKGLKTKLSFENGTVSVTPFDIKINDEIAVNVVGSHSFDKQLAYNATLNVPAKYLGSDVNNLIAKIDDKSLEGLTIPVKATIGGNYTSPSVNTDLTSGVKQLTAQLVEIQKQKLLNQGKDKAKNLLGDLLNKNQTADSAQVDTTKASTGNAVKDALGGLLNNKKKTDTTTVKKDTIVKEDKVKDAAKSILGGLLGKKKKDSTN